MYFLQLYQECERQKVLCLLACPTSSINLSIRVSGLTITPQNLKNVHNYTYLDCKLCVNIHVKSLHH